MAVDIVINWAADGLVLCFMHAVVDLTARDNDENNKTGWTNWCGTPYMSMEQVQLMYQQLLGRVPQPSSMTRVFQVLLNQPDRPLWMSWPPDPAQGHGPTSKDFARLAEDVQIGNSVVTGTDAKTSCTRRYKALQTMHYGGNAPQEVESIFIPYGLFSVHLVSRMTSLMHRGQVPSFSPVTDPALRTQGLQEGVTWRSHRIIQINTILRYPNNRSTRQSLHIVSPRRLPLITETVHISLNYRTTLHLSILQIIGLLRPTWFLSNSTISGPPPIPPSHRLQRLATCARLLTPLPSSCNRISGHRIPRTLTRTLHHTPFRRHRGCRTLDQVRPPCLSPLVRPLQAVMPFPPPGSPDEVQETHTGTEAEAQVTRRSESIGVPVVR